MKRKLVKLLAKEFARENQELEAVFHDLCCEIPGNTDGTQGEKLVPMHVELEDHVELLGFRNETDDCAEAHCSLHVETKIETKVETEVETEVGTQDHVPRKVQGQRP